MEDDSIREKELELHVKKREVLMTCVVKEHLEKSARVRVNEQTR